MKKENIPGFDGRYAICPDGRVISYVVNKNGRTLKPAYYPNGYQFVGPVDASGKRKLISVHRLVASAFIPNPENKQQVNHKNCIKDDNRVENLEWCDRSYNMIHAYRNGRRPSLKKISPNHAKQIRRLYNKCNYKHSFLAQIFCVGTSTINRVINRIGY